MRPSVVSRHALQHRHEMPEGATAQGDQVLNHAVEADITDQVQHVFMHYVKQMYIYTLLNIYTWKTVYPFFLVHSCFCPL